MHFCVNSGSEAANTLFGTLFGPKNYQPSVQDLRGLKIIPQSQF